MNTETAVLDEVTEMIRMVLEGDELDIAVTVDTSFQRELEFESIDIVVLGNHLGARYGEMINFPRYLAELDLDQIIALTVGDLVDYVESCQAGRSH
ncbi:MAG: acyl carrier protein [Actinomycetota bacterium]|nr:acyl carrier protein [Actinomycetota bacterium]